MSADPRGAWNASAHPLAPGRLKGTIRLGIKSLWSHRLRSLLTALGIVFGVSSVISMLAIGEGASYEAQEQIRQLGSNNIIIESIKPPEETRSSSQQTRMAEYGITYDDVARIQETIPGIKIKVPGRRIRKDVWHRGKRVVCDIFGTVPDYPHVNNHPLAFGRFFNDIEMRAKANVCVLDLAMAEALFPIDPAIGQRVLAGQDYYTVVGVLENKASRAALTGAKPADRGGGGAQHRMYIPLTAARERFGEILMEMQTGTQSFERVELHEVIVQVDRAQDVLQTWELIKGLLARHHKKADYRIIVPLDLLRNAERTKQIFNIVLGGIAALSLLVGGIGIMNIMLASVTERTREIGIRRALGAKRVDIIVQFLVETVMLSSIGGLIGIGLGLAIPILVEFFAEMPTIVTLWSPIMAFGISALVGVVFGIYPAIRAADMDPVEALRHE